MADAAPTVDMTENEAPEASTSTSAATASAEVNGETVETKAEEAQQEATAVTGDIAEGTEETEATATATADAPAESGEPEAPQQEPEVEEPPQPTGPPAVETLYINNLNEKVPLKIMKQSLKNLFKSYGVVLDVVMHSNVRMRGQAFVAMASRQAAGAAVKEVRGFPLYGKPMNVSFARTPSDAVVKRKTPDLIDVHLEERKKRKSMPFSLSLLISNCTDLKLNRHKGISRKRNPLRKKAAAAKGAAKRGKCH